MNNFKIASFSEHNNNPQTELPSPCRNICQLDADQKFCIGCLRTLDEIAAWGGYSNRQKQTLLAELDRRRATSSRK